MKYCTEITGTYELTLTVEGDIDHHNCIMLREATDRAIRDCKPDRLIIDFSRLDFMDSSGFGFVMGRYKSMRRFDGSVIVRGCSPRIERMLKMSGADRFVKIESEVKI